MVTFDIKAYGRPLFENRSENCYIAGVDNVTLEKRQELCKVRSYEFGDDFVKSHYYGDGFELKEEESVEE